MKKKGTIINLRDFTKLWDDCNFIRHLSEKYGMSFECVNSIFRTLETDLGMYKSHRQHVEEFIQLYLEGKEAWNDALPM